MSINLEFVKILLIAEFDWIFSRDINLFHILNGNLTLIEVKKIVERGKKY